MSNPVQLNQTAIDPAGGDYLIFSEDAGCYELSAQEATLTAAVVAFGSRHGQILVKIVSMIAMEEV